MSELERLCGQLIVVGFEGATLPDDYRQDLEAGLWGGVILFKRNLPDVAATHGLCRAIAAAPPAELPPFICLDEEGGRVTRLPAPLPVLPAARHLGETDDPVFLERAGAAVGRQLKALGFNVNFAPVLDVDTNPANPIIGARSYSRDPERVAALGLAFARGLDAAGVVACGKHFPGHGDTATDSHWELPVLPHDRPRMDAVELLPFKAGAEGGLASVMSAHVLFPAVDDEAPGTISRKIIDGVLRRDLAYRGVVFTDCLEMKAIADGVGTPAGAVASIDAGCDVLLVCHTREVQVAARAALVERAASDAAFRKKCEVARDRALALRRRLPPAPAGDLAGRVPDAELATMVADLGGATTREGPAVGEWKPN